MTVYRVRFSPRAWEDATEAGWQRYELTQDPAQGQAFTQKIYVEARERLEAFPGRQPVQERESNLFGCPVHRLRIENWHLYYRIEDGEDGPLVTVLFLWNTSRLPIDNDEAERIKGTL